MKLINLHRNKIHSTSDHKYGDNEGKKKNS